MQDDDDKHKGEHPTGEQLYWHSNHEINPQDWWWWQNKQMGCVGQAPSQMITEIKSVKPSPQSVAIAFGHSLKIRATKLTCEWIFSSKTETLWRLRLIIIIVSPTFLAFQRHHLHYSPSSNNTYGQARPAIAEVEYTTYIKVCDENKTQIHVRR